MSRVFAGRQEARGGSEEGRPFRDKEDGRAGGALRFSAARSQVYPQLFLRLCYEEGSSVVQYGDGWYRLLYRFI